MQQSDHTRWGRGTMGTQMTQDSLNAPARSPAAGGRGDLSSLERLRIVRSPARLGLPPALLLAGLRSAHSLPVSFTR